MKSSPKKTNFLFSMIHWRRLKLLWIALLLPASSLLAQQKIVNGTVTSETGEPLQGVSVQLKNAGTGAFTDKNGKFSIVVPDNAAILVVSFIGYQAKELPVKNSTALNIKLQSEAKTMNDVVVIGYGSVKRNDLTGSVSTIKGADLNRQKAPSFLEAMQGKVAGVQITSQSGEPGAGVAINIRGSNSL
ncbi:MAG: carboxypeptidase-like regulatory domain-containing protein, partial [Ferruginibacter sp.]